MRVSDLIVELNNVFSQDFIRVDHHAICQHPMEGQPPLPTPRQIARAEFSRATAVFVARLSSYSEVVKDNIATTTATLVPMQQFKGNANRFLAHHSSAIQAMDCTMFRTIRDGGYYVYFGGIIAGKPVFKGALHLDLDENGKFEKSSAEIIKEFTDLGRNMRERGLAGHEVGLNNQEAE